MSSDHPPSPPASDVPPLSPHDIRTPQTSRGGALDSAPPSSAADPLLGARDSCELDSMGKTKDDTSIVSGDEFDQAELAPIHHGDAVWESRDTYGPAGMSIY